MSGIVEALAISAATSLITAGLTYALTPSQKVESGRINDLTSGKSNYGAPLPWCWGKVRVGGNLIWTTYLEEVKKKQQAGKGTKVESTTYSYFASFAAIFADCRFRPLVSIDRVWMNKKLVYSTVGGAETIAEGGKFADRYLTFYLGEANQEIDPLLQNVEAISNYNYGLPTNPLDRDAFLRSLGIDPTTVILTPAYNHRAYLVANRLPLEDFYNAIPTTEAELLASENCTVGQILGDIFSLFYEPEIIDTSLIDDIPVEGFFLNSVGAAKQAVQNLQKAYFLDIVKSNGQFKFIPLNNPRNVINLTKEDLAAHQSGSQKPLDYEIISADPATLPSEVLVSYIDQELNYDTNEQRSQREVRQHYNPNTLSLTFPIIMSASQAATIADRSLLLAWIQSKIYKFSLPPAFLDLEPTDVIDNVFDDSGYPIKINQTRIGANLIVQCEAVPHDITPFLFDRKIQAGAITVGVADYNVAIAVSGNALAVIDTQGKIYTEGIDYSIVDGDVQIISSGGIPEGTQLVVSATEEAKQSQTDVGVITSAGNTELIILDIPLIKDTDDDYTIYLTGGGGSYWKGGNVYISVDNSRYILAASIETYGIYGNCISDYAGNNITVEVNKSELESITDSDMALGFNLALIGKQICQFKTATLTDTNIYQLSEITMGLRGTETEPDPVTGDRFVLLTGESAVIARIVGSATDLGKVRYFKALSSGQALDEVAPIAVTIQGNSQKPYAPVNLAATSHSQGINITWDRRDRHDALNTQNPPLSEAREEYAIEILGENGLVIREVFRSSNSYIYSEPEQLADFGSLQTTISVKVAQVSADVGAGSYAIAELTPQ